MKNLSLLILFFILGSNVYGQGQAKIVLKGNDIPDWDKFELQYWEEALGTQNTELTGFKKILPETGLKGELIITIEMERDFVYFSIMNQGSGIYKQLLNFYIVEVGDSVIIDFAKKTNEELMQFRSSSNQYYRSFSDYREFNLLFSGLGAVKYECRYRMDDLTKSILGEGTTLVRNQYNFDNQAAWVRRVKLDVLGFYEDELSENAANLMGIDIYSQFGIAAIQQSQDILTLTTASKDLEKLEMFKSSYLSLMNKDEKFQEDLRLCSPFYNQYLYTKEWLRTLDGTLFGSELVFDEISAKYTGIIREKLLLVALVNNYRSYEDLEKKIEYLEKSIERPSLISVLEKFNKKFMIGAPMLNFSLLNKKNEYVTLSDLRGKILIVDFWFTGCGACTRLYKNTLLKVKESYARKDEVEFVSISIDRDREQWLNSIASGEYTSTDAVNLYTNGEGGAHELIRYYGFKSYPTVIIVDKEGRFNKIIRGGQATESDLIKYLNQVF